MSRDSWHGIKPSDPLTPEERALLLCARPRLSRLQRQELSSLLKQPTFDWASLEALAQFHRMSSWVAHHMTQEKDLSSHAPSVLRIAFRNYLMRMTEADFSQWRFLRFVASAFSQAGVSVIVLKGVVLHQALYSNDSAPRGSADLDLLIRPEQRLEAQSVLEELKFRFKPKEFYHLPEEDYEGPIEDGTGPSGDGEKLFGLLDLQWALTPSPWVQRWRGIKKLTQLAWDLEVPLPELLVVGMLPPELTLLQMTLNLYKDGPIHFRGLMDVAQFLVRYGAALDWDRLEEFSVRCEMRAALGYSCLLAKAIRPEELEGIPLPPLRASWLQHRILRPLMTPQAILRRQHARWGLQWMWPRAAFGPLLVFRELLWYHWCCLCYDRRPNRFKRAV